MKFFITGFSFYLMSSMPAFADFNLSQNGKKVTCYADDNQSIVLNAKRTTIKYTVEGESAGAKEIINVETKANTSASYTTEEGVLTLSNQGDTWQFAEEDVASSFECK
jgi:hypothetical protein